VVPVKPVLPAVTCSVKQHLTGQFPSQHGIVANGWYFRDECEIKFWQSNRPFGSKVWEVARSLDPTFTCANLFWWYSSALGGLCSPPPRCIRRWQAPIFMPSLGVAITTPSRARFPYSISGVPNINSLQPVDCRAAKWVEQHYSPTLSLVYSPISTAAYSGLVDRTEPRDLQRD